MYNNVYMYTCIVHHWAISWWIHNSIPKPIPTLSDRLIPWRTPPRCNLQVITLTMLVKLKGFNHGFSPSNCCYHGISLKTCFGWYFLFAVIKLPASYEFGDYHDSWTGNSTKFKHHLRIWCLTGFGMVWVTFAYPTNGLWPFLYKSWCCSFRKLALCFRFETNLIHHI